MVDIGGLIHTYGYLAVAVGTLLEGETVLVAAGVAAHHGYLSLPTVIVVATLGGFLGDQIFFFLGRRYGTVLLVRFPSLQPRAARVTALLDRYHVPLILAVRFLYGLRTVGPAAIGMSSVSWVRFSTLNLVGAIVWAALFAGVGYGLGQGLVEAERALGVSQRWVLALFLLAVVVGWVIAWRRKAARKQHRVP